MPARLMLATVLAHLANAAGMASTEKPNLVFALIDDFGAHTHIFSAQHNGLCAHVQNMFSLQLCPAACHRPRGGRGAACWPC
jgi:hypothetical protein